MGRWILPDNSILPHPGVTDPMAAFEELNAAYGGNPPEGARWDPSDWDPSEGSGLGGKTEWEMFKERAKPYGRAAGDTLFTGGGAVLGGTAGASTGVPFMGALGAAEGAALGHETWLPIEESLFGPPEEPDQSEWYERMLKTGALSLAAEVPLAGIQAATKFKQGTPKVAERLGTFRKYGAEPVPSQIAQSRGYGIAESGVRYNIITGQMYETQIARQTQKIGDELLKILPSAQKGDAIESMNLVQLGLKKLQHAIFDRADDEFAKVGMMVEELASRRGITAITPEGKPVLMIPAPNFQRGVAKIRYKKPFLKKPGEVTSGFEESFTAAAEYSYDDLMYFRRELNDAIKSGSPMIKGGVTGTRGYATPEVREYIMLRNAIDDDIKALSPEIAGQMARARGAYAQATKLYEKQSAKDVLFAINKEQPGLVVDRFMNPARKDTLAIQNLKKMMPKESFEEIVGAKVEMLLSEKGLRDPRTVWKWVGDMNDNMIEAIATRPGQAEALRDMRDMYQWAQKAERMSVNPSQTGQAVASIGVLGGIFATAVANPAALVPMVASGGALMGTSMLYLTRYMNSWVAQGLMKPQTARYIHGVIVGAVKGRPPMKPKGELDKLKEDEESRLDLNKYYRPPDTDYFGL